LLHTQCHRLQTLLEHTMPELLDIWQTLWFMPISDIAPEITTGLPTLGDRKASTNNLA
jgi:hypothetical protein